MLYHDFYLASYSVRDYGRNILLYLVSEPVERPQQGSTIEFSNVGAYHFIHTSGAIITGITEFGLRDLMEHWGCRLGQWSRQHGGYLHWDDNTEVYCSNLENHGYRAWNIDSAIGFEGFVIAKAISQKEPTQMSRDRLEDASF